MTAHALFLASIQLKAGLILAPRSFAEPAHLYCTIQQNLHTLLSHVFGT